MERSVVCSISVDFRLSRLTEWSGSQWHGQRRREKAFASREDSRRAWVTVHRYEWEKNPKQVQEGDRIEIQISGFREAGRARFVSWNDEGAFPRRTRACIESRLRIRVEDSRRKVRRCPRDRSFGARQQRSKGLGFWRNYPVSRVLRLHREIPLEDGTQLRIPAKLKPAQIKTIQKLAVQAFRALELSGMARVDFFLRNAQAENYSSTK